MVAVRGAHLKENEEFELGEWITSLEQDKNISKKLTEVYKQCEELVASHKEGLKARGVLIVPGEYFFIGQDDSWDHAHQCLRMNYVQDGAMMQKGIDIIAEEVLKAYSE